MTKQLSDCFVVESILSEVEGLLAMTCRVKYRVLEVIYENSGFGFTGSVNMGYYPDI